MERRDEELMRAVAAGDLSAMQPLYERYKKRLITYAYYVVGNREQAEDILQETFIRVFRHARRFDPEGRFSSWIYTIAANLCRDEIRRKMRRRSAITQLPLERTLPSAASGEPSPRKKAAVREFSFRLREEMRALPLEQREVITLHYLHGMKYREIAGILGCPLGTVQSRLHTALRKLREKLGDFLRN